MKWSAAVGVVACSAVAVAAGAASPVARTPPAFVVPVPLSAGDAPQGVAIADVDGDRKLDLVTVNAAAKTFSVFLNDGRDSFKPRHDYSSTTYFYASPTEPGSVAVVDVDGDGMRDVLNEAPLLGGGVHDGTVSIHLNHGDGTFEQPQVYRTCSSGVSIATGDVNRDGKVDFATGSGTCNLISGGHVQIFQNDGNGSVRRVASCGLNPVITLAIGNLNGDPVPDLVATHQGSGISVLLVNGGDLSDCNGKRWSFYATGKWPSAVALGDLNDDGKADVVTSNSRADTVSVLLNNGNGSFAPHVDYAVGDQPRSLAIADLNGDHRLDLVTGNHDAATISVLVGRDNGGFEAKRDYRTNGTHPSSVAIGDLNGDRQPDLAVANDDEDVVSVFFNKTALCRVPDVRGKTLAGARSTLARAHCRTGAIRHASSKAAAKNRVVSQRPAPGAVLPPGGPVSLVVGRG